MLIFWSDARLERDQRQRVHWGKGIVPTPEDERRAAEDARELREHARWRGFAYLLFVVPLAVGVTAGFVAWILEQWKAASP
jgi:hypothetical protein